MRMRHRRLMAQDVGMLVGASSMGERDAAHTHSRIIPYCKTLSYVAFIYCSATYWNAASAIRPEKCHMCLLKERTGARTIVARALAAR